jgi:hypothetical protein
MEVGSASGTTSPCPAPTSSSLLVPPALSSLLLVVVSLALLIGLALISGTWSSLTVHQKPDSTLTITSSGTFLPLHILPLK